MKKLDVETIENILLISAQWFEPSSLWAWISDLEYSIAHHEETKALHKRCLEELAKGLINRSQQLAQDAEEVKKKLMEPSTKENTGLLSSAVANYSKQAFKPTDYNPTKGEQ